MTVLCTGKIELLSFLTGAQDSHLQRVTIPETAYIELRRRPPEDEQGMLETCRGFELMYYMEINEKFVHQVGDKKKLKDS